MSRELLKRALDFLTDADYEVGINWDRDKYVALINNIETYLAQPEPEPVAWMGEGLIVRSTEDLAILKRHEPGLARLYNTPLYTTQPDQSARIAELEKDNAITHENLAWYMAKYREYLTEIEVLKQQLAALQAKQEPLNYDQILDALKSTMGDKAPLSLMLYDLEFCRAIEAAHGITGGEK